MSETPVVDEILNEYKLRVQKWLEARKGKCWKCLKPVAALPEGFQPIDCVDCANEWNRSAMINNEGRNPSIAIFENADRLLRFITGAHIYEPSESP